MKMNKTIVGILAIFITSCIWGSMGIFVRLVAAEVTTYSQVMIRMLIASFLFLGIVALYKPKYIKITKKDIPFYMISGIIGYGIMIIFFTIAVLKTSIANVYFLMFTQPIFAIILAALFLHERISKRLIIAVILCFFGVFLIFNPTDLTKNILGNVLALLAGFSSACYVLVGRYMGKKYSPHTNTLWAFLFALILIVPLTFILEDPFSLNISTFTWFLLFVFALFNLSAYALLNFGLKRVKAGYASIILAFEAVSSVIYGFLFYREIPSLMISLGAVFITFSVIYLSLSKKSVSKNS